MFHISYHLRTTLFTVGKNQPEFCSSYSSVLAHWPARDSAISCSVCSLDSQNDEDTKISALHCGFLVQSAVMLLISLSYRLWMLGRQTTIGAGSRNLRRRLCKISFASAFPVAATVVSPFDANLNPYYMFSRWQ